jgi:MFS superfamily sulfate permease-like transporter
MSAESKYTFHEDVGFLVATFFGMFNTLLVIFGLSSIASFICICIVTGLTVGFHMFLFQCKKIHGYNNYIYLVAKQLC